LAKGIQVWVGEFQNKKPLLNNNDQGEAVIKIQQGLRGIPHPVILVISSF
jgi:hypothetical protein